MLFLIIILVVLILFFNKIWNFFLVLVIGGFFGLIVIGVFLGVVFFSMDNWCWVFVLGIFVFFVCLFIGYKVLFVYDLS